MYVNSIFPIKCNYLQTNYTKPWMKSAFIGHGTGFCITIAEKKYIMTNYHVVKDSIFIQVGDTKTKMIYGDRYIDLAILECPFHADTLSLGIALPTDEVTTYGYPEVSNHIAYSYGTINRIYKADFGYCKQYFYQIDAAGYSGSSGSPVFNVNNEVIGVIIGSFYNTLIVIPFWMVDFFIKCFLGQDHFRMLNISWQHVNPLIVKKYGEGGILIHDEKTPFVAKTIESIPIEAGQIRLSDFLTYFGYIVPQLDDWIPFHYIAAICGKDEILFDKVTIRLHSMDLKYEPPIYHIYGGYVFVKTTMTMNEEIGNTDYPVGSVVITEILQNEYNEFNKKFKWCVVDCTWEQLPDRLAASEISFIIIQGPHAGRILFIDSKEKKYTETTRRLLFQ